MMRAPRQGTVPARAFCRGLVMLMVLACLAGPGRSDSGKGPGEPAAHPAVVQACQPVGRVLWTEQTLAAQGSATPDARYRGTPAAQEITLRTAAQNAHENLVAVAGRIRVDATHTVAEALAEDGAAMTRLFAMARQAAIIDKKYLSDGTVEVLVNMELHGGFSQLFLPEEIQQVPSVRPVGPNGTETPTSEEPAFTGLVADARGLFAMPALAPRIVDEDGREVYGPTVASRDSAVHQGTALYVSHPDAPSSGERVGPTPLVVKGLRASGDHRCDIVISRADAARIRSSSAHLDFLKKCRVTIVIDTLDHEKQAVTAKEGA